MRLLAERVAASEHMVTQLVTRCAADQRLDS